MGKRDGQFGPSGPELPGLWWVAAQASDDAVFGVDAGGRVTDWTKAARRLFGYEASEAVGMDVSVLFGRELGRNFADRLVRVRSGETLERVRASARRRDGMLVPVRLTMAPTDAGRGVCLIVRDLTEQVTSQEALASTHKRMLEALQLSKVGFWLWDLSTDAVQMSEELYRIYGVEPTEFAGRMADRVALVHPADRDGLRSGLEGLAASGTPFELDYRLLRADGAVAWIHERATVELQTAGGLVAGRGVCQDVTEERISADILRRHTGLVELLHALTMAANEASDMADALNRCLSEICVRLDWKFGRAVLLEAGGRVDSTLWFDRDPELAPTVRDLLERDQHTGLAAEVLRLRRPVWSHDLSPPLRTGFAFPVRDGGNLVAAVELLDNESRPADRLVLDAAHHASMQLSHVAERERTRDALEHQAMHDALTDLPNRGLFLDRLGHSVRGLREGQGHSAVMFIDLDNFKLINDSLGHDVGDRVLTLVAARLVRAMREGDTAARFGGDEFIILCERLTRDEVVGDIANRLLSAVSEPIPLTGEATTVVTASIGIALATTADARPEDLVRDADAAMYRAKEEGRNRFHIFDPALHERASRKLSVANELRSAVERDELHLVYQPQYRLSDGAMCGVEALARWDNPARGRMNPADWIPVAEETQLIVPIGEWILHEACRAAREWMGPASGPGPRPDFRVCVNVSAVQLTRPELIDSVVAALERSGLAPSTLCLEITESVLMSAPGNYLEALYGLKLLGVSLAVDDFGTGYSSLAYLSRFPIDVIKIDKGFIDGLGSVDGRGRSVLRAVAQLADALGLLSVAEGVETEEQARSVAEAGCHAAQGFYFARPAEAEQISEHIAAAPRIGR